MAIVQDFNISTSNKTYSISASGSDFNTSGYVYPVDLLEETNNKYGKNYVVFHINVHEDSVITSPGASGGFMPDGVSTSLGKETLAGISETTLGTAFVAQNAVQSTAIAAGISSFFGGGDFIKSVLDVAAPILGYTSSAATVNDVGSVKAKYKLLKSAIVLHVNNDLNFKYGASWGEEDFFAAYGGLNIGQKLTGDDKLSGSVEAASQLASATALNSGGISNAIQKTSGTAVNPKKESLFRGVDFRNFTFTYTFSPRSQEESTAIKNIINELKLHMMPEPKANNPLLLIYPSEFDIKFYNGGKENDNIPKIGTCVLTDLSISYSPQGQFNTFKDGTPTQTNVTMTFRELHTLDRKVVAEDGL